MAEELVVGVFDDEGKAWDAVVSATEVAAQRKSGILDACPSSVGLTARFTSARRAT